MMLILKVIEHERAISLFLLPLSYPPTLSHTDIQSLSLFLSSSNGTHDVLCVCERENRMCVLCERDCV